MITGPIARPSSPSVRLTALDDPTITKVENNIYQGPISRLRFLINGYRYFHYHLRAHMPILQLKLSD